MDYKGTNSNKLRLVEPGVGIPSEVDAANDLLEQSKNTFTGFVIVGFGANENKGLIKVMQTQNLDGVEVLWLHKVMEKYINDSIVQAPR